ncbi:lipopolysaccharide biosynthesis protein [Faecalicatena contorta]|nr:oligosaccharide flippase family protein [Faecalicatena contorta]
MIGSMLMAFQSVIMLMILTRTLGLLEAGIFTIAYANANLFLTIGRYGMRYFQVSDVKAQFGFIEYKISRVITSAIMIMVAIVYIIYAAYNNGYSVEKTQVIIWMCIFKVIDAMEDVYHGLYQKENRLDVASRVMSVRMIITIVVFGLGLIFLKDLLLSLIITTVVTAILFLLFTLWTFPVFQMTKEKVDWKKVGLLLKLCFPLFAGSFLSFYIGNAPKYAIDAMLTDELQACYGFIAMPVFVIGLLNSFIFNPMLYQMSVLWNERKIKKFVLKTCIQVGLVGAITVICIIGAYLIGVPVLSWLYNTDLSPYCKELLVLLLGGGFLGVSGLLNAVITIIRNQNSLMWGYAIVAVLAFTFSNRVVEQYKLVGASVLYTSLMGVLCLIFIGVFIYGVQKSCQCDKDVQ